MNDILFSAFLLSVVLVGIHSYFGLEIIKRGIIFTDLAVGQMSAVGASISILFFEGKYIYLASLMVALLGGFMIAVAQKRSNTVEAFIGLLYAFGISAVYILLSKSSHGMEEFQKLMAADILFTPMDEILRVAVIYLVIGAFIYFVVNRTKGFLRDVLFFVTFAATVTSSVKIAGVLIVFALLVSPALIAMRIRKGKVLINAWLIGIILNIISIAVSYEFDFPTGYTVVFFNAAAAIAVSILQKHTSKQPV